MPESITSEILECENSKKGIDECTTAFRVTENEVGFYKRFNLPLPNKCPNCRHRGRLKFRTMPRFHMTKCENCKKEILTAYDNKTPNLYCKECYLQTVI